MTQTIGIDIGGTKVAGGVVDETGNVVASTLKSTPATDPSAIRDVVAAIVTELCAGRNISAVGIGAAGWIDSQRSTVQFAPNLAWRDEPLKELVAERVNLPVVVENDANVAAWAEYRYGAAKDVPSAVLFTVGTGIGGGIVWNGNLVRGSHGIAAELGHTLAVPDGRLCGCGRSGCLEQYASGNALVRFAKEEATRRPNDGAILLSMAGDSIDAIEGPMVTDAAFAGDDVAISAFNYIGHYLGEAMVNVVQILDPDVIIIGGGVIKAGELLLQPVRDQFVKALHARGNLEAADIVPATMGRQAGIIGAADLARY